MRSDLVLRNFAELDEAEEQIQEILGGYHLGLVLMIKNNKGNVLYKNLNAKKLGINPPTTLEWQFTDYNDNFVRIFTQKVPGAERILQIGTVVNQRNLLSLFFSRNHIYYFVVLVVASAFLAWIVLTRLFSPVKRLAEDLNIITSQLTPDNFNSETWDTTFTKSKKYFLFKNDEFGKLIHSVQNLLTQIRLAFQMNKNHSARLAHEVNTPLSLIKNRLKELESGENPMAVVKIHQDIDRLADFVHRYLEYSESLNTPQAKTDIYAIRLNNFAEHIEQSLKPISENRIKIRSDSRYTVFANHHDLEHLVQNLVTNALKYSPAERDIYLNFKDNTISVSDQGEGIPQSVLDKMGSPFNIGTKSGSVKSGHKGTGLGLAWVHAISKKYDWKLDVKSSSQGTQVTIQL